MKGPAMYRRHLLLGVPAFVLAACQGGQTVQQITQTVVTDIGLIANGVINFVSVAQGLPQATVNTITDYASKISDLADQIGATMAQNAALPIVQQISADVDGVAAAVQGKLQAGSQAATILADIRLLLPLVQLGVGMVSLAATPSTSGNATAARARLAALPKRT